MTYTEQFFNNQLHSYDSYIVEGEIAYIQMNELEDVVEEIIDLEKWIEQKEKQGRS